MTTPSRDERRATIQAAAYDLLLEKGYKSTSMIDVAKRASASNETLYRWYGNKAGLVAALVEENARQVRIHLSESIADGKTPMDMLRHVGPDLLALVTSERAVMLNRAAVVDLTETGTLGGLIATFGRETVAPLIGELITLARDQGALVTDDIPGAAETYINLLIGDAQIRRVIGVMPEPSAEEIVQRATRAFDQFQRLYGAPNA